MTLPELPPEVARELADLRRRVGDLERARTEPLSLLDLTDVHGSPWASGVVPTYNRESGLWEHALPSLSKVLLLHATAPVTLTTSYATMITLPGFTTKRPNAHVLVTIVCDFQFASPGANVALGRALLAGTPMSSAEAILHQDASRATVAQQYAQAIANPSGPWVAQLQVRKLDAAGPAEALDVHTTISAAIYD